MDHEENIFKGTVVNSSTWQQEILINGKEFKRESKSESAETLNFKVNSGKLPRHFYGPERIVALNCAKEVMW